MSCTVKADEIRGSDELSLQLHDLQVLLVDYHPDSLCLGKTVLESYNINVTTAVSVEQALHRLQQCRPHLVITELYLPNQDGYCLMRQLKALEGKGYPAIPTIALTTQSSASDRQQTFAAGFHRHIAKPFEITRLIKAIADLMPPELAIA
jgi:CheY-like chemotaxis protein